MQFLRTVFWVVLAVVAVIFAFNNWEIVSVHLWGDLILDSPLPVLLLLAFLIGLLPALVLHRATSWNLRRKLDAATRAFGTTDTAPPSLPAETPTTL